MQKAAYITPAMPAFSASPAKSDDSALDPTLLFGGIGVLAFLVAIVTGVQGVWY
jgi:hypothetical protein